MSRFNCKFLPLALVIAIGCQAQTTPALWRFVHPDAKAVISIDWSRIRTSHIGTMLREKFGGQNPAAAIPGIEFLDSADRFIVSSSGKGGDNPAADAPMLLVVGGHFDLAKVRAVLLRHGAKPQQFNSFQVYRPQGKDSRDLAFVLFDPQTILIGDSRSIFASLERAASPATAPEPNSVLARVAEMEANYEAWAVLTGTDVVKSDRLNSFLSGGALDAQAQGMQFGMSMRNGLAMEITILFDSEGAAKKMATELSRMVKLAVKDKLGEPAMLDLEKRLKFNAQGTQVKLALRMTPQELEKNAQIFAASRKQVQNSLAEIKPVIKSETVPPEPPKKQVIRIEGLDDGTREIPFKDR